jgi:hypothetical protein
MIAVMVIVLTLGFEIRQPPTKQAATHESGSYLQIRELPTNQAATHAATKLVDAGSNLSAMD